MDDFFNEKYCVGDYEIGKLCYQSYPCKHSFKKCNSNECDILSAIEIFKILDEDGLSHPHFDYCQEIIRRHERPTKQELDEQMLGRKMMKEQMERDRREYERNNGINGASSRLDRLKNKNNCKKN